MEANGHNTIRKFQKLAAICTTVLILLIACVSCVGARQPREKAAAASFPFGGRVGWFHGSCLAIADSKLTAGTPITLVIMGEPQKLEQVRIRERTTSSQTCSALIPSRAAENARGMFFYALETKTIRPTDMGIGIVASPTEPRIVDGLARIDLDRDGHSEVFSSCATSEGIKFGVWSEKAYQGEPRWSAYYYLGYDQQPNCP